MNVCEQMGELHMLLEHARNATAHEFAVGQSLVAHISLQAPHNPPYAS